MCLTKAEAERRVETYMKGTLYKKTALRDRMIEMLLSESARIGIEICEKTEDKRLRDYIQDKYVRVRKRPSVAVV